MSRRHLVPSVVKETRFTSLQKPFICSFMRWTETHPGYRPQNDGAMNVPQFLMFPQVIIILISVAFHYKLVSCHIYYCIVLYCSVFSIVLYSVTSHCFVRWFENVVIDVLIVYPSPMGVAIDP